MASGNDGSVQDRQGTDTVHYIAAIGFTTLILFIIAQLISGWSISSPVQFGKFLEGQVSRDLGIPISSIVALFSVIALIAVFIWLHRANRFAIVRRMLEFLYFVGGVVAALFLIAILSLIVIQMLARWTGEVFPGAPDYAGYCMASASFFAFAYALNHGAHIRVSILLSALGSWRRWGEIWCFALGTLLSTYFAYYAIKTTRLSRMLNDISQGQDATPIWIPQMAMSIGAVMLAICFWDNLVRLIFTGQHSIRSNVIEQSHGE